MSETMIPNLAGVATKELVESIGGNRSYINWSRTLHLLREHAPGWMPEAVPTADGSILHRSPAGGYLLIRFRHIDGRETPTAPQAVMDNRNNAIAYDKISARDITDTHRRGTCLAACYFFGLAYELWAKVPLESGYAEGGSPTIDEKQAAQLSKLCEDLDDDLATLRRMLNGYGIEVVGDLPASKFGQALKGLNNKMAEKRKAAA